MLIFDVYALFKKSLKNCNPSEEQKEMLKMISMMSIKIPSDVEVPERYELLTLLREFVKKRTFYGQADFTSNNYQIISEIIMI